MATDDKEGLAGHELLAKLKDDPFQRIMRHHVEREGWGMRGPDVESGYVTPLDVSSFRPTAEPRPDMNSKHLMDPVGNLYVVIGGIAWYYGSWDVYRRVHYACHWRRVSGTARRWVCPRHYAVQSVDWIATAFMDATCELRRSPYNGDAYFIHNNLKHLITAPQSFDNYQFDWDDLGPAMLPADFDAKVTGAMLHETRGGLFD